jgi:hypothetical protein
MRQARKNFPMKMDIYIRDRDGSNVIGATVEAESVLVYPRARWNTPDPDQHGAAMVWAYDDQRSMAVSPLNTLLIDGSVWTLQGVGFDGGMRGLSLPSKGRRCTPRYATDSDRDQ